MTTNSIHSALFGLAVGDALGVPVEFRNRKYLKEFPVSDMQEYGTHHQPRGTWSDDSSLAFCLAHSLLQGFDLKDIALRFTQWTYSGFWTPHGKVFDIGIQTRSSIYTLQKILSEEDYEALELLRYEADEYTNGNGSLMRILPLLFYIRDKDIKEQFEIIWKVSALTHGHIRSAISCLIYLVFAEKIITGYVMKEAYERTRKEIKRFFKSEEISNYEVSKFSRLIYNDISKLNESEIGSSGYVIDTLEASFWCLLNSCTYKESVLKAVNLGDDTDTTGAVVGGLAGLVYGYDAIPETWLAVLARKEDITELCDQLTTQL